MIRKEKNNTSRSVYRFKIWTRKSYSVFNSLGKLISIGFLSTDLSEKIGTKNTLSAKAHGSNQGKIPAPDDDQLEDPVNSATLNTPVAGFLASVFMAFFLQVSEYGCECSEIYPKFHIGTLSFSTSPSSFYLIFLPASHLPYETRFSNSIFIITFYKPQFIYSTQIIYGYET